MGCWILAFLVIGCVLHTAGSSFMWNYADPLSSWELLNYYLTLAMSSCRFAYYVIQRNNTTTTTAFCICPWGKHFYQIKLHLLFRVICCLYTLKGKILRPFSGLAHSKLEFVKIEGDTMCVKRNCLMPLSIWGMGWGQSMLNLPEDCCIPAAARDKDLE